MLSLTAFDINYENELIKELAEESYQSCQEHAQYRTLENYYVIEKFLSEFSKLARKDGIVK